MTIDLPADVARIVRDAPYDEDRRVPLDVVVSALVRLAKAAGDRPELLIASGVLARESWRRLRAESADVLASAEPEPMAPFDPWRALVASAYAEGLRRDVFHAERAQTRAVERAGREALVPRGRSPPNRRVTMDELTELLGEALRAAAVSVERDRAREERRALHQAARAARPSTFHADDVRADVLDLADRLARAPCDSPGVVLRHLARDRADLVGLLQAALALAKQGDVVLVQEEFPTSPLRITRAEPTEGSS